MKASAPLSPQTYPQPLSRIEAAGWAVIASKLLAIGPGESAILRDLALRGGAFVSASALASNLSRMGRVPAKDNYARATVSVRVSRVRRALMDLGFPWGVIENDPESGYTLPARYARQVRDMVEGGL